MFQCRFQPSAETAHSRRWPALYCVGSNGGVLKTAALVLSEDAPNVALSGQGEQREPWTAEAHGSAIGASRGCWFPLATHTALRGRCPLRSAIRPCPPPGPA